MSYFLVKCDGGVYANDELYIAAIAKGEHALIKMLAKKAVRKLQLMDQTLYYLDEEQQKACEEYNPTVQDFDAAFKCINIVSKSTIEQIKGKTSPAFPGATVISITPSLTPELFKYRQATFFRIQDYKPKEYRMVPKMAAIKVCGRLYAALNAVNVHVETPIIVTPAA